VLGCTWRSHWSGRFVELSHTTADARVLLYQINPVSHVGEINSGLNSGDAAAYDEHSFLRQSKHLLLPRYLNVAFSVIEKARLPPETSLEAHCRAILLCFKPS